MFIGFIGFTGFIRFIGFTLVGVQGFGVSGGGKDRI